MIRHFAVALALFVAFFGLQWTPAAAAHQFYVRIQGPKPAKPGLAAGVKVHVLEYSSIETASPSRNQAPGNGKWGAITIKHELSSAMLTAANTAAAPSPQAIGVVSPTLTREIVTVGCDAFDVQADYGSGPMRGVLARQSIDGLCIFAVPMPSSAASAIVRIGLPTMPPGWSFNSQPKSKCIRSGETLDGTLGVSQDIFSFQWGGSSSARSMAPAQPGGPCGK